MRGQILELPYEILWVWLWNDTLAAGSDKNSFAAAQGHHNVFVKWTDFRSLTSMKKGLPKTLYCWGFLWPFPWRCRQGLYTFLFSKVHQAMNETSIKAKRVLAQFEKLKKCSQTCLIWSLFSVQSRSCVWLESSMQMLWIIIVNVDNS